MAMSIQYPNYRESRTHYAMQHNWNLVIASSAVPGALSSLLNESGAINASCIKVNGLPNSNAEEGILAGNIRGVPFHQAAGRESSVREMTFTMYEFYDYRLFRFFECWKSMAVNRYDLSQNLSAILRQGVSVVMYETDRAVPKLTYNLFDTVCTKCALIGEYASDPQFAQVQVSLKCGYYNILKAGEGNDRTSESLANDLSPSLDSL